MGDSTSSNRCIRLLKTISRKKEFRSEEDTFATPLRRYLGVWGLTFLGLGSMFGSGLYVLTGAVAHQFTGPAVVVSYFIAGIASLLAALCYSEISCRIPRTGSSYIFTYVTIGEIWAFLIGWNMILEFTASAASLGRSFSGYVDQLCNGAYSNYTIEYILGGEAWDIPFIAPYPDFLGAAFCMFVMSFVLIGVGTSAILNNIFLLVNLIVLCIIIIGGAMYSDIENWEGDGRFAPFGFGGVMTGAATLFYSYVGFDVIAMSSEECVNPKKNIPIAMISSIALIMVIYMGSSVILTLMIPYEDIIASSAFSQAFAIHGVLWAKYAVTVGAICSFFTALLTTLFCLPRSLYAMASDGLIFEFLGKVNERTQVPIIGGVIFGFLVAILNIFLPLVDLVAFLSIGCLCAYGISAAAIVVLRYRPEGYGINFTTSESEKLILDDEKKDAHIVRSLEHPVNPLQEETISAYTAGTLKERYRVWPILWRLNNYNPGTVPLVSLSLGLVLAVGAIAMLLHGSRYVFAGEWWAVAIVLCLSLASLVLFCLIPLHYQNDPGDAFSVPLVPLIPITSVLFNFTMMLQLTVITWIRFTVWMLIGFLIYVFYGYGHSKAGKQARDEADAPQRPSTNGQGMSYGSLQEEESSFMTAK